MSSETDDLDEKLRALPAITPPAEVTARALHASRGSAQTGAPLAMGPRVVLFITVLCYLGWAFRTASLLGQ